MIEKRSFHTDPLTRGLGWSILVCCVLSGTARAEDWPTYRHDNQRSGITTERLQVPLAAAWTFVPRFPPEPAWEAPRDVPVEGILELGRAQFDDTYHVAVAGDAVFFGSSADFRVYCLERSTGRIRWSRFTEGPVRLAPTVVGSRLFFGSDDGSAYCLDTSTGKTIWSKRVGPTGERLLGSGKMVSRWPVRTGVLVADGVAYCGAGIWPSEGVYMQAMKAADGGLVWRNDTIGETTDTIVSPQGYLLATKTDLFVPQGRVPPAAFSLADGRYKYTAGFGKTIGGTSTLIADGRLYTGTEEVMSFEQGTRRRLAWFEARQVIVTPQRTYMVNDKEMVAIDRDKYAAPSTRKFALRDQRTRHGYEMNTAKGKHRRLAQAVKQATEKLAEHDRRTARQDDPDEDREEKATATRTALREALAAKQKDLTAAATVLAELEARGAELEAAWKQAGEEMAAAYLWRVVCECPEALILAGDLLFAGGRDKVVAVRADTGEMVWSVPVEGKAKGLAVANGRLYVSTDTGRISCFASPGVPVSGEIVEETREPPADARRRIAAAAASSIVRQSGTTRGYGLVLGCGTGYLALELARRTELTMYAVFTDPAKAAAARTMLAAAGLYGQRVSVDTAPLDDLPYADYFANLVVSELPLQGGDLTDLSAAEIKRVLKPCGGRVVLGRPAGVPGKADAWGVETARRWLASAGLPAGEVVEEEGLWIRARRGALPGAGAWTHQYADAGNTTCSYDYQVKCPLGLLWYGRPGPLNMVSRHRRAAAPLTINGILFVQSEHQVTGYDAYNGIKLCEYSIPNVVRDAVSHDCSNLAADETSFYVATGAKCLRLDAATGKLLATYALPGAADGKRWGYIAYADGVLFGSRTRRNREGDALFAIDTASGDTRWVHQGKSIHHASISVGDGRIFFVDNNVAGIQRREALRRRVADVPPAEAERILKDAPVRTTVCLDVVSGEPLWERPLDLTGGIGGNYWSALGSMYRNGVLVLFGIYMDGHYWKDFFAGQFKSRRVVALDTAGGHTLWEKHIGYRVRPLIIDETLHAEPWAYDLRTGKQKMRNNPVTGREEPWQFARPGHHCGCPAASPNVMFFRSQHIGYYDLVADSGVSHFSTQRTGCWINFIFGNGLVMIPEASSACMCPFANQTTVVFQPRKENRSWTKYSMSGPMTPVQHLALNLGAPGDRKAPGGPLWLGYPRPRGSLVLRFDAKLKGWAGGGFFKYSPDFVKIAGTSAPWAYTSGYRGLRQCSIPLVSEGEGKARYTVRLLFADMDNTAEGVRVFDIRLQGKTLLRGLDIAGETGGARIALVKEFAGIEVDGKLTVDLVPKVDKPTPTQAPILQGVEVVRETVLTAGLISPSFLLNRTQPSAAKQVRIANHKKTDFEGVLRVRAPAGFTARPLEVGVRLAAGNTQAVTVTVSATPEAKRGDYPLAFRLVRRDGGLEIEGKNEIEFLGNRQRMVVKAVSDVYVGASFPKTRRANTGTILVDGGNRVVGDESHHVAYLKFPIEVPGKPLSAVLRIFNASNPTSNGGNVCLVTEPWDEKTISYETRPAPGRILGNIGPVASTATLEIPLKISLEGKSELGLAIDPVNCDGTDYITIEGGKPAELVVEYQEEK